MKKLDSLKKSALESCIYRGHKMGKFGFNIKAGGQGIRGSYECQRCGKRAFIDTNPAPNSIEISGEAIALNCN
jgi:hypothetical protein